MDKHMYKLELIEKKTNNNHTRYQYAIQNVAANQQSIDLSSVSVKAKNGGNTSRHSNSTAVITGTNHTTNEPLESSGAAAIVEPPCNPFDIMPRLIKAHKEKLKYGIYIISLLIIGMIIASSVFFVLAKQNETKGIDNFKLLVCGISGAITSLISFIILCFLFHVLRKGFTWMNNVIQIIQLDGKTWQYEVDSLENTVSKSMLGLCEGNLYSRFKRRPYGHVVLTEVGLIIDEVLGFEYEMIIVLRVDLINNVRQTGWILRMFLVTSQKSTSGLDKGTYTMFHVDLFMPPYMHVQEVIDIRDIILSKSYKHLIASKFYVNSQA